MREDALAINATGAMGEGELNEGGNVDGNKLNLSEQMGRSEGERRRRETRTPKVMGKCWGRLNSGLMQQFWKSRVRSSVYLAQECIELVG